MNAYLTFWTTPIINLDRAFPYVKASISAARAQKVIDTLNRQYWQHKAACAVIAASGIASLLRAVQLQLSPPSSSGNGYQHDRSKDLRNILFIYGMALLTVSSIFFLTMRSYYNCFTEKYLPDLNRIIEGAK